MAASQQYINKMTHYLEPRVLLHSHFVAFLYNVIILFRIRKQVHNYALPPILASPSRIRGLVKET